MTQLLYLQDSYLRKNEAVVVAVHPKGIMLDKTCFFPEGGGQPGDSGSISGAFVSDTRILDGDVVHLIREKENVFQVGDRVCCEIDWPKRFERMQAHSAEHILSGLANSIFGCENVGFHMDDVIMTVDFDRFLTEEDLLLLEEKANICVYEDHAITCQPLDPADQRPFRSKLEDLKNPRIVTIEGIDRCACCAPHLSSTAQIGILKILSFMRHRGGIRLTLAAGKTAYEYFCKIHKQSSQVGEILAVKPTEIAPAVNSLIEKNKSISYEKNRQFERLITEIGAFLPNDTENRCVCLPDLSPEELKTAAMLLKKDVRGLVVVFSGSDPEGYSFAMTSDFVDVKTLTRTVTAALSGRGGGRFDVVQGRFNASRKEIETFFAGLKGNKYENA